jgi:hypothetical protein
MLPLARAKPNTGRQGAASGCGSVEGLGLLWSGTGDATDQLAGGALRAGALAQPVPNHGAQAQAAGGSRSLSHAGEKTSTYNPLTPESFFALYCERSLTWIAPPKEAHGLGRMVPPRHTWSRPLTSVEWPHVVTQVDDMRMPFGKYKDHEISAVPDDYLL